MRCTSYIESIKTFTFLTLWNLKDLKDFSSSESKLAIDLHRRLLSSKAIKFAAYTLVYIEWLPN